MSILLLLSGCMVLGSAEPEITYTINNLETLDRRQVALTSRLTHLIRRVAVLEHGQSLEDVPRIEKLEDDVRELKELRRTVRRQEQTIRRLENSARGEPVQARLDAHGMLRPMLSDESVLGCVWLEVEAVRAAQLSYLATADRYGTIQDIGWVPSSRCADVVSVSLFEENVSAEITSGPRKGQRFRAKGGGQIHTVD